MRKLLLMTAAIGVAACAQEPAVPYERVTEEMFNTQIVGKKLVYKDNHAISHADGTVTGTFAGGFTGTWQWVDGYWCREITDNADIQTDDCQLFEIAGNKVRNTRDKGTGRTVVYTLAD